MNLSVADFQALLRAKSKLLVFTGAGASADSGIGTFRRSDHAWWAGLLGCVILPVFGTKVGWQTAPRLCWFGYDRFFRRPILRAKPNACHRFLGQHLNTRIISQNVDGLHQRGGTSPDHIAEIHGTIHRSICASCGALLHETLPTPNYTFDESTIDVPSCACGGCPRPDATLFGEVCPVSQGWRAARFVGEIDVVDEWLVLIIGTSGAVPTCHSWLGQCQAMGARIILIDPRPTDRMLPFATDVVCATAQQAFADMTQ